MTGGNGRYVRSVRVEDPEAVRFFLALKDALFR